MTIVITIKNRRILRKELRWPGISKIHDRTVVPCEQVRREILEYGITNSAMRFDCECEQYQCGERDHKKCYTASNRLLGCDTEMLRKHAAELFKNLYLPK